MFSLSCAIWAWLTESANILLDLANAGRDAENPFVIAIVATLAAIRTAAFLLAAVSSLASLKRLIWSVRRKGEREETSVRVFIIIILIVSIAFEVWVSPERRAAANADNAPRIEAGDSP